MERTNRGISVWFWSRQDGTVPQGVREAWSTLDTSQFGQPSARFIDDSCDWNGHFGDHRIVFDLTFCGDWAGTAYGSSGCPGSCQDFVRNTPSAFTKAYWQVNSLRTYTSV